jgi:hypothetical protein
MTEHRRAAPATRRLAMVIVMVGAIVGALLIVALERYRTPILDWLLSEPEHLRHRVRLAFLLLAVALSAPLVVFATYLWFVGVKAVRAREILRGRGLRALALCLGAASVMLCLLLWRLAEVVSAS